MNQILGYRQKQKKLLEANPDLTLGDVTTVNMTMISGGVQMNVVPNEFTLGFDFRITPTTNLVEFDEMLRKWSEEVSLKCLRASSFPLSIYNRAPRSTYKAEHTRLKELYICVLKTSCSS